MESSKGTLGNDPVSLQKDTIWKSQILLLAAWDWRGWGGLREKYLGRNWNSEMSRSVFQAWQWALRTEWMSVCTYVLVCLCGKFASEMKRAQQMRWWEIEAMKTESVALWLILKDAHQLHQGSGHWCLEWGHLALVWLVLNSLCNHHSVQGINKAQQLDQSGPSRFKSSFHHLLAPRPWPNHLNLLSLGFASVKWGWKVYVLQKAVESNGMK